MSCFSWLRSRTSYSAPRNGTPHRRAAPRFRPRLEALEDRNLPSTYSAATTSDLIADINAANKAGGANSIMLTAPTTSPYALTVVDNTTNGANGLPVISGGGKKTAADNLTIVGNGDTIERSTASGTPAFRLFDVAGGSSLTLEDVTLQNGLAFGSGAAADGGAIYNQGTLTLNAATVQGNTALGSEGYAQVEVIHNKNITVAYPGADAAGGGIWSSGTVTLEGGTTIGGTLSGQGNQALGGRGIPSYAGFDGGTGGGGFGGGLYQAGGSVIMSKATVVGNQAAGGAGGSGNYFAARGTGGTGAGGGLYVASGTLVMSNDIVSANTAEGGRGGRDTASTATSAYGWGGSGLGGGLYVAEGTVTLTGDTVTGNGAYAGFSGHGGVANGSYPVAVGGGIDIASSAKVSLDSFTVTNTTQNYDYKKFSRNGFWVRVGEDDIDGSYTLT